RNFGLLKILDDYYGRVHATSQCRNAKHALVIGFGRKLLASFVILDGNGCAGHNRTSRILHSSRQRSSWALSEDRQAAQCKDRQQDKHLRKQISHWAPPRVVISC